jgi:UDP-3-O-[3-hydroxymyristoyl] glucosamine N-acyltransferase
MRLSELAEHLGARVLGDPEREVVGVRPLDEAGPEHLSFLTNPRYGAAAVASRAGAILVGPGEEQQLEGRDLLQCEEPYLAFARVLELFHPPRRPSPGVHPSAILGDGVRLGDGVAIGPLAVLGDGVRVGARTVVGAGCVLGPQAEVGDDCLLHPHVVIEDRCRVGDRCILHSGVVIGSDGFGFATSAGTHHKVPQVGVAVLEDDVELGANVCVDRATLGQTRICRGAKVDNLVQIAHNVEIGEGSLLVSQVGIAGSTRIGHHAIFGGQAGAVGHVTVGDNVVVTARGGVMKDLPDGVMVSGMPARPTREWTRANANLYRLDALRQRLAELERRLEALEASGDEDG